MSLTVSSPAEICNSPLNLSISKQLYSFSKADRFDKLENPTYCKQAYYDPPSALNKRSTTLGYGSKSDLAKKNFVTPACNIYKMQSEFDLDKEKHKGFQFGVSRDHMVQSSIFGQILNGVPGPGKYNNDSQLSDIRYTMRAKTDDKGMILNNYVPGPGSYTTLPALTAKGKYNISKFKNSGACVINPKTKRFPGSYANFVPGPGQYSNKGLTLQKTGQYHVAGFTSSPSRSFPHDPRITGQFENVEKTPGPGTYRLPSDFGHYQAKNRTGSVDIIPEQKEHE